jgi:hypothetical protein
MPDTTKKAMTLLEMEDAIAKTIADEIGHGMREKCIEQARAVMTKVVGPQLLLQSADAISAHLAAQREGEAVAFTSIDDLERLHDDGGGIGRVEVNSRATAHRNVPLYISPPHPNLEVTEELAERVAEALQQNGWASGADYEEDFLPDVRAAVEAALSGNAP